MRSSAEIAPAHKCGEGHFAIGVPEDAGFLGLAGGADAGWGDCFEAVGFGVGSTTAVEMKAVSTPRVS